MGRGWLPPPQELYPRSHPYEPRFSALRASILRLPGYNDPPDLRVLEYKLAEGSLRFYEYFCRRKAAVVVWKVAEGYVLIAVNTVTS